MIKITVCGQVPSNQQLTCYRSSPDTCGCWCNIVDDSAAHSLDGRYCRMDAWMDHELHGWIHGGWWMGRWMYTSIIMLWCLTSILYSAADSTDFACNMLLLPMSCHAHEESASPYYCPVNHRTLLVCTYHTVNIQYMYLIWGFWLSLESEIICLITSCARLELVLGNWQSTNLLKLHVTLCYTELPPFLHTHCSVCLMMKWHFSWGIQHWIKIIATVGLWSCFKFNGSD